MTGMAILFLFPIGFLICSYFSTLYVWIKIIYHVNFSKLVEKVFPFLGKSMIGAQVVLMIALVVGSIVYWPFYATNVILGFFLLAGAIGFAIFGKMIWREYKDLSSKDCGVFSESTHAKIQKVTKLSAAAITVTFITFCLFLWSFITKYPLNMASLLAFVFVGRGIEVSWIISMLLVLSPSLQTWNHSANSNKVSGAHFDDLSDSSIDIENEGGEISNSTPSHSNSSTTPTITDVQAGSEDTTNITSKNPDHDGAAGGGGGDV
eukprot:gene10063-12335_t